MPKLALLDPTKTGRQARNLESELRHLIVGQEEAINQIVKAYQTHLAGLSPISRPVGSVAVALDFTLRPNCGTRSDLSLSKQSAHAPFLCRFVPMVAVMQTTEAHG